MWAREGPPLNPACGDPPTQGRERLYAEIGAADLVWVSKMVPSKLLPLLALALVLPAAGAGGMAEENVLFFRGTEDGNAYVGMPVEFGYAMLTADEVPGTHQNGHILVEQNNVVLYETTEVSSHDYNGVNTFLFAFPTTGPYRVLVEVPGLKAVEHEGMVLPAPAGLEAAQVEISGTAPSFTVAAKDAAGALLPNTDLLVELRRPDDQWLVYRALLYQRDAPATFDFAFGANGDYLLRAVAFDGRSQGGAPDFLPGHATTTITIDDATGLPAIGTPGATVLPPAADGPYRLLLAADPQSSNTMWSRFVLDAILYDPATQAPVMHTDFAFQVTDAAGDVVYQSQDQMGHDGQSELVINLPTAGRYKLEVVATQGETILVQGLDLNVAAPVPPTGMGVLAAIVTATGLDQLEAGKNVPVVFKITSPNGQAVGHAEIDFQIVAGDDPWATPLVQNKLHSHGPAELPINVAIPSPGMYQLVLNPVTIHGDITPNYYYGDVGGALVVPLDITKGVAIPAVAAAVPGAVVDDEPAELPGPLALVAIVAALGAALWRRRD